MHIITSTCTRVELSYAKIIHTLPPVRCFTVEHPGGVPERAEDMETYLVTGAMGLIGTNLCLDLLRSGHRVLGVDNFACSERERLEVFQGQERFRFIEHDVIHPLELTDGIDGIYHLACPARHPLHKVIDDPLYVMQVNALGIIHIGELARKHDAKLVYTSTAEIYGIPDVIPTPETFWGNTNPVGERSSYDESKRFSDAYCVALREKQGVDAKIVRVFNAYGPYMDDRDGRAIPAFILQALRGDPLTVYGDGSQTRSFCFVEDTVRALVAVMGTDRGFWGPVNAGNPQEVTIRVLAEMILRLTGSDSAIDSSRGTPSDDPPRRVPDITAIRKALGWVPRVGLEEGLARTIDYYQTAYGLRGSDVGKE